MRHGHKISGFNDRLIAIRKEFLLLRSFDLTPRVYLQEDIDFSCINYLEANNAAQ
jgi:hypothetical protein